MTDHTAPPPGPRTLADQIRHCAQRTAEPGNDAQRAGIAVTLQGIANQIEQIEREIAELQLRAERAENARDQVGEMLHAVQAELAALVRTFHDKGHPGEPCLRSGWVPVRQIAEARQALALAQPAAEVRQPSEAGRCPECGDWVHLDGCDQIGRHPVGPAGTAPDCPGVGMEPEARRPLYAGPRPGAPQSRLSPPGNAAATTDQTEAQIGRQEPAQAATGYRASRRRQNPGGEQ